MTLGFSGHDRFCFGLVNWSASWHVLVRACATCRCYRITYLPQTVWWRLLNTNRECDKLQLTKQFITRDISGSHGSAYEDDRLLGSCAMWSGLSLPTFRRCLLSTRPHAARTQEIVTFSSSLVYSVWRNEKLLKQKSSGRPRNPSKIVKRIGTLRSTNCEVPHYVNMSVLLLGWTESFCVVEEMA
jgi:hypothetical protein